MTRGQGARKLKAISMPGARRIRATQANRRQGPGGKTAGGRRRVSLRAFKGRNSARGRNQLGHNDHASGHRERKETSKTVIEERERPGGRDIERRERVVGGR